MTSPATPQWHPRTHAVHHQIQALCAELATLPTEERLTALAHLEHAVQTVVIEAVREAAVDARTEGWPLRRIGLHLNRSHEQIRLLTLPEVP
ncbi:hypothetical protein [Streptomyces sp. NPDC094466]|uniref:hypothetical protein n=1 Tax=Streptomyces sp. NPDC094466 TaxID=3366065 RepID=UPI00382D8789